MFNITKFNEIKELLNKTTKNCQIIAISKNHPVESVEEAIRGGVRIFGENRVMEAKTKFSNLKINHPEIELHLTGPLQSNKVKLASNLFDVFHTLDREKIAKEFYKYSEVIRNKKFFVQVNTGEEKTKSGVYSKYLTEFLKFCRYDMSLNIIGLMCIPPINESAKIHFKRLKDLTLKNNLKQISIGMSSDYLEAVPFDPSYIRLGTILFGKRN